MSEINISLNMQPGTGFSPVDSNSLSGDRNGASSRSPLQDSQLLEALGVLLTALLPNLLSNGQSSSNNSPLGQAAGTGNTTGQNGNPAEMLMKMLETLMPSNNAQGAGSQGGVPGGNNGTSPLSGATGANGAQNPENLGRSLLQDTTCNALNNAISPTADGGGQISGNMLLKALMELIANLMDMQQGEFGQPQNGTSQNGASPASTTMNSPSFNSPSMTSPSMTSPSMTSPSMNSPTLNNTTSPSSTAGVAASTSPLSGTNSPTTETGKTGAVNFPTAGKDVTTVNDTIKVGPSEVFDGGGKTFVAGNKLGDGSQAEGQKPIFELAEGATLKNVVFGDNAADGVHVRGDAKIDNVHWTNVGEDALTVKSNNGKPANVEITNSSAQGASDKIFQLNADANLTIDNFKAKDFGTFVRTNGGQQGNWNLNLSNIDAENGKFSFVKSDSAGLNVTGSNLNLTNVNNPYKVPQSANLQVN
ncbi:pectate lyase-like protein|uniref:pectate lyase n=1 Tax=Brenneria salicis ATCC 15712 = DSM 30166 TaxID=714314 RepID=A0A366I916_9GAMM|nr:pectate lyase [Brenneria salicis]NMN91765.1 pectate lyase-like protein [Brenneria salicis ATCC 15712 = DSM 30166]RBP65831.1 pectate lyase-like protein [Brenneria salicis ATCC 15712 = DSM 30166]RLM31866.1 pectate lyase [Brenneria salicis ATCC 15712 = DSM 30166]